MRPWVVRLVALWAVKHTQIFEHRREHGLVAIPLRRFARRRTCRALIREHTLPWHIFSEVAKHRSLEQRRVRLAPFDRPHRISPVIDRVLNDDTTAMRVHVAREFESLLMQT